MANPRKLQSDFSTRKASPLCCYADRQSLGKAELGRWLNWHLPRWTGCLISATPRGWTNWKRPSASSANSSRSRFPRQLKRRAPLRNRFAPRTLVKRFWKLKPLNMSVNQLAKSLAVDAARLNGIVRGRRGSPPPRPYGSRDPSAPRHNSG